MVKLEKMVVVEKEGEKTSLTFFVISTKMNSWQVLCGSGCWRCLVSLVSKTFEDEGVSKISCGWVGSMGVIKTKTKACCALGGLWWQCVIHITIIRCMSGCVTNITPHIRDWFATSAMRVVETVVS